MRPPMKSSLVGKRSRRIAVNSVSWTWQYDRRIPSDPHLGVEIIRDVLDHLEGSQWPQQTVFGIHMSLEEAVMNAIKHGNLRNQDKHVHVTVKTNHEYFYVKIVDEGTGFDPRQVPDPTADENLERECGRGLMLMRCYMDDVRFNRRGNAVELFKRRD